MTTRGRNVEFLKNSASTSPSAPSRSSFRISTWSKPNSSIIPLIVSVATFSSICVSRIFSIEAFLSPGQLNQSFECPFSAPMANCANLMFGFLNSCFSLETKPGCGSTTITFAYGLNLRINFVNSPMFAPPSIT